MTDARRAALIAKLVAALRGAGSWTGETHVQKTVFFLQELLGVPLGFKFQLYKYGPFSFELRDQLQEMRALHQLRLEPQPQPYGPKLGVDEGAAQLERRFPKTVRRYSGQLDFVVQELADSGVSKLERLATALLVDHEMGHDADLQDRVARLRQYKPHITEESAREAFVDVATMRDRAVPLAA